MSHYYWHRGERATGYYEKLIGMRGRSLGWEPQQSWIAAHTRVAEFYRSRGDKARAIQALSSVADLWRQADAGLPLAKEIGRLQKALRQEHQ